MAERAESWADTIVVVVPLVQCGHCGSPQLIRVRSNLLPSGDIERLHICRKCSRRSRWRISKSVPVGECHHEID